MNKNWGFLVTKTEKSLQEKIHCFEFKGKTTIESVYFNWIIENKMKIVFKFKFKHIICIRRIELICFIV